MKRLFPVIIASFACLGAGCALWPFSNKKPRPKPDPQQSPLVSTQAELEFRQRWVDKRSDDLVAQGMLPDAAHAQALAEFRVKFSYTHAASMP
jgi:hypothetical protein